MIIISSNETYLKLISEYTMKTLIIIASLTLTGTAHAYTSHIQGAAHIKLAPRSTGTYVAKPTPTGTVRLIRKPHWPHN